MGCLDENTILALIDGQLDEVARARAEIHLGSCPDCGSLVAGAVGGASVARAGLKGPGGPAGAAVETARLDRGATVGRYVILDLVGRGGMGEVYAAYDPQLDRKIALKLLHQGAGEDAAGSVGRARLLREAKAIARLQHPNVVIVHDAGAIADSSGVERVFLAMEFVEGKTVADWLVQEPRGWRQIRDVFVAAGEGLAAAHDAELVHRDFKPQNVMVGRDGTVRVMDFGLAGDSSDGLAAPIEVGSLPAGAPSGRTIALTRTGMLLGTPLYMAPEQLLGRGADARTDQFAFCVALHEALYGERPFPCASFAELFESVVAGRTREPTQRGRVPTFLRRLIARGLRPNPDERWPSIRALLAALGHDPVRRRKIATISAVVAVVVAGVAVGAQRMARRGERICRAGGDKVAGIWDLGEEGQRRQAVRAALHAAGGEAAEETWTRVSHILDDYTRRWLGMYQDACEATHVRGEQSADVLDLRMSCLDGPRAALRALTGVLAHADAGVAAQAVNAAQALPPLDRCADVLALREVVPPPRDAATRAKVDALRPQLAEVKALADTGRWNEARRRAAPLLESARAIGYPPFLAELLAAAAWPEQNAGDMNRSVKMWEESIWAALAGRRDDIALMSAAALEGSVGYHLGRFEEADRWDGLGRALLDRLGPGHELAEAWLDHDRGITLWRRGEYQRGLREVEAALALKRKVLPPDHPDIAHSLTSISAILGDSDDLAGALQAAEQAVDVAARAYGRRSPSMAQFISNRGELLSRVGREVEAEHDLRAAIAGWSTALGPSHPFVAYAETALGKLLVNVGRAREAVSILERAQAVRDKAEPKPDLVAETRFALARARWETSEHTAAIALAKSARELYRKQPSQAKSVSEVGAWLDAHPVEKGTVAR